jgi:hypothetical protein
MPLPEAASVEAASRMQNLLLYVAFLLRVFLLVYK